MNPVTFFQNKFNSISGNNFEDFQQQISNLKSIFKPRGKLSRPKLEIQKLFFKVKIHFFEIVLIGFPENQEK